MQRPAGSLITEWSPPVSRPTASVLRAGRRSRRAHWRCRTVGRDWSVAASSRRNLTSTTRAGRLVDHRLPIGHLLCGLHHVRSLPRRPCDPADHLASGEAPQTAPPPAHRRSRAARHPHHDQTWQPAPARDHQDTQPPPPRHRTKTSTQGIARHCPAVPHRHRVTERCTASSAGGEIAGVGPHGSAARDLAPHDLEDVALVGPGAAAARPRVTNKALADLSIYQGSLS